MAVLIFFRATYGQGMLSESNSEARTTSYSSESESSLEEKIKALVEKLSPEEGLFCEEVPCEWISWELTNVGGFF